MIENKILYQIKTLEKMIFRHCIENDEFKKKGVDGVPEPVSTQAQIIRYILQHGSEEIYQKDLENILNLRRATVSGVLQTMEKNGLIKRVTDLEDTRTKKIILQDKAKVIFSKNKKALDELEDVITKGISKKDLEIFSKVINKMKENIGKTNYNKTN